jgi:GntR family transcriptional regulator
LAGELQINPRTVVKAYEELNHEGLVVMKQGQGVFVTVEREVTPADVRDKKITELARRMLAEASRMGANKEEVLAIIRKVVEQMEANQ